MHNDVPKSIQKHVLGKLIKLMGTVDGAKMKSKGLAKRMAAEPQKKDSSIPPPPEPGESTDEAAEAEEWEQLIESAKE